MTEATASPRIAPIRRAAAATALVLLVGILGTVAAALRGNVGRLVLALVLLLVVVMAGWAGATRTGTLRIMAIAVAVVGLLGFVVLFLTAQAHGLVLVAVVVLSLVSVSLSRYALHRDRATVLQTESPGERVGPATRGVLIMNPKSGGGKATKFALADEARKRGIEPVVLSPGDDLLALARDAIDRGADVIGMAGGDGSQALVASVAMTADVPLVCIPAGTRNHFALDIGLDRDDVVGALDAFGDALERRIDLSTVGDRVFVNNVSLGVYAKIVQSPEYRDAKRQTTAKLLPEMLGPDAEPFDLRFTGPDGEPHTGSQIIQVSNNPYVLTRLGGFGTRARLDTGTLGIATAEVHTAADAAALVAAETAGRVDRFKGWLQWNAPTFTVESDSPIEAGVDGEALVLDSPLEFRSLPGALRVRIPVNAPGYSPAALSSPSWWWTIEALFRAVAGHATPIDETQR